MEPVGFSNGINDHLLIIYHIMRFFFKCIVIFMPWRLKHWALTRFWHYKIHPSARIGLSYIYPKHLVMETGAKIGHFNVAIHLDKLILGKNSSIGRNNWITGFPTGSNSKHFAHDLNRRSEFIVGEESAITKNHHIDCTNSIYVGNFATIAGYGSQFLTHSIDIYESRQDSHPIAIGDYSFVSTRVIVLGGAVLPAYSVLAAGAVLNKAYNDEWTLYTGVPAKPKCNISKDAKYFSRSEGFIY